jgi:GNAT superfamily N-acetyltransferase
MDLHSSTAAAANPAGPGAALFGKPPAGLPRHLPAPPSRVLDRTGVALERVDLARKPARRRFLDVADAVQGGDPHFISPLRMERMKFLDPAHNPALQSLEIEPLIATVDGRLAGRITAHVDRAYDAYHRTKAAWFGFFESVDDPAVAHALLDEAVAWARRKGAAEIIGPVNFTLNHQAGMLVENFDRPPFVEMTYNPSYYERLVASYGFGKAKDLLAFWIDVAPGTDDARMRRYLEVSEKAKARYGLRIRPIDMKRFAEEVALLFRLYNESWQDNWGFVPMTEPEFEVIAKDLKPIAVDSLILLVEDTAGKPVAFSVALPNVNELMPKNGRLLPFGWWKLATGMKRIRHARLFTLGVLPGFRRRGIESLLCIETALRARQLGMAGGEIGWTLEDNVMVNRAVESFGGRLDRRYRLFGLDLG